MATALWGQLLLLITSLAIGRSVGSALFLGHYDGRGLALVYIYVGLTVASMMTLLERWGSRHRLPVVAGLTLVIFYLVALVAAFWLSHFPTHLPTVTQGIFYLLIESFAFITIVQFWAMTNSMFWPEQARRWYVFVASGGIFGSILGGSITRLLAHHPIAHLLLLMGLLIAGQFALLVLVQMFRYRLPAQPHPLLYRGTSAPKGGKATNCSDGPLVVAAEVPPRSLVWRFGLVSLLAVFSTTLVDYYFKLYADGQFAGRVHDLTSFFGTFYLIVGGTTLLVQGIVTPWLLRRRAVFAGLASSPFFLALLAAGNLSGAGLWAAVGFKLADSVLSHSVYRSCQEVLFTSLPVAWVRTLKARADGVFGRYGLLLAGLVLSLSASALEWTGPPGLLPWIMVALTAWAFALAELRREYRRHQRPRAKPSSEIDSVSTSRKRQAA